MTISASPMPIPTGARIPFGALILGWAGVIPFAVGAVVASGLAASDLQEFARAALQGYGAAILSFMAGVQWGVGMMASVAPGTSRPLPLTLHLGVSVLPALVAWVALLLPFEAGLLVLAVTFAMLLVFDLALAARGIGPIWYRPLRLQLSAAAIASLLLPLLLR